MCSWIGLKRPQFISQKYPENTLGLVILVWDRKMDRPYSEKVVGLIPALFSSLILVINKKNNIVVVYFKICIVVCLVRSDSCDWCSTDEWTRWSWGNISEIYHQHQRSHRCHRKARNGATRGSPSPAQLSHTLNEVHVNHLNIFS